jgi:uncharacterized protein (TIGR00303 family)
MRPALLFAAAPARAAAFASRWRGQRPSFCCVLAHTDTCLIPGVSAAGVTEEVRPLTPAADAEAVLLGAPRCLATLPSNPLGAPGPASITRAAMQLGGFGCTFVGSGLLVWPETPCRRIAGGPGANIELGHAVPHARDLFDAGYQLGRTLGETSPYVVLGESVPGGTTTALALLLALGIAAEGRVSGSQRDNAHALKTRVARTALAAAQLAPGDGRADPLGAAAAVGDPMQPIVAGAALGAASVGREVLLAGGSQMLAVAALTAAVAGEAVLDSIAIGTTRWIVTDPAADVVGLAAEIAPSLPVLAANVDFSASRHIGLRAYETFLVKEGVGAGGACVAALIASGATIETLEEAIDAAYDEVIPGSLTLDAR